MRFPKPINSVEKKIFHDKEFLTAVRTGKSRKFHREGTIENHIIHILKYIDNKYKNTKDYENLRILAILHDIGKFAFLEKYINIYLPEMPVKEQKRFIASSRAFAKKYPVPKKVLQEMKEYIFTPQHAYVSYVYSKKFVKNKGILDILKYHDLAVDMMLEQRGTKKYDAVLFKKIFSNIDLGLYLLFLKCDNSNRKDTTSKWLKTELKRHNLIK